MMRSGTERLVPHLLEESYREFLCALVRYGDE